MPIGSSATPLPALDAVAIDTKTTGLDARKARILEIRAGADHGRTESKPSYCFRDN
jgi:hypothetical protein